MKKTLHGLPLALFFLLAWAASAAQEPFGFNELAASEELQSIQSTLDEEDVDSAFLTNASSRIVGIETSAASCVTAAGAERARLEQRYAPLIDVADDVPQEFIDQRNEIRAALDEAIAAESRCTGIVDQASKLQGRISARQTELSQEFLSNRSPNVVTLVREFPIRAATWPAKLRESLSLDLVEDLKPVHVMWLIIVAGIVAALAGVLLRLLFGSWYRRSGGDDASPKFRYLLPKPVAEFAPLWLVGIAFIAVLQFSLELPTIELLVMRVAWAVFMFGIACVVIDWATGPLSPSAQVKGLIPDHVRPLRLRLRVLFLTICASFVVLGSEWLSVRVTANYVSGRASMIFLVAVAFLYLFAYLPKIPGIKGRFRLMRLLAVMATGLCIVAVLSGYQNFAAFLIHGVTRTGVALFILWILIWLVYVCFDSLLNQETPAAERMRASLGVTKTGKGTGMGFMRLVADIVLWLSFIVYMIYVWDESGSTLGKLYANVLIGWQIGGMQVVPIKFIGGILIFASVIIVIGWLKRWIDRRWLRHIVIERGARDAIMTLFGYVGFVVAVLVALAMAEVDLTGLALVSGALALGIGFGMQEIANNFVSGLILLFERPIRAGDFVTVGEVEGFVRSIRIRATEIETLDNQNVLVPNSELVSGRVINWVLRDTYGRLQIKVGVAYGSNIETVRDILESISREHPEVITDGRAPAPRALFMGFGDSSLDFEVRVRIQRIERRFSVVSDLNFAIDAAFRDAGIKIPFPQRDLHIVSYPGIDDPVADKPETQDRRAAVVEYGTRSHSEKIEVAADVADVWKAITDADAMQNWAIESGEFSPYVGGRFDVIFRGGYPMAGRTDIYLPHRRLRTVISLGAEEKPLPSGPITIEFTLRQSDKLTAVNVNVTGIPDSEDWEEYYRLSVDRWSTALAELKTYLLAR